METVGKQDSTEIRLVLIGRTGSGKSASGNTLLGTETFKSSISASSGTSTCQIGTHVMQNGTKLKIVDTPGLFDTSEAAEKVVKEISRCVSLTSPGPHLFLYVLSIGRFTNEDTNAVQMFLKHFGKEATRHTIVLFTKADMLDEDQSINEYLDTAPKSLLEFLRQCSNRFFAVDNKCCGPEQVDEIVSYINKVISENNGSHYSNEMYLEHIRFMKEKEEEIRHKQDASLRIEEIERKKKMEERVRKQIEAEKEYQRELQREIRREENRRREEEKERKERERIAREIRQLEEENRRRRIELQAEYEEARQEREIRERQQRRKHRERLNALYEDEKVRPKADDTSKQTQHPDNRYCIIL